MRTVFAIAVACAAYYFLVGPPQSTSNSTAVETHVQQEPVQPKIALDVAPTNTPTNSNTEEPSKFKLSDIITNKYLWVVIGGWVIAMYANGKFQRFTFQGKSHAGATNELYRQVKDSHEKITGFGSDGSHGEYIESKDAYGNINERHTFNLDDIRPDKPGWYSDGKSE